MDKREFVLNNVIKKIGLPVQRQAIQAGNVRTHFLLAGKGEPVILIHGGDSGAGAVRWYPVIASLAKCFQVIAPDVVGYGETDKPWAAYDRPYFATWLGAFIKTLGIQGVNLVGHSAGGAIALHFALEHPESIERLVLVNAAGLGAGTQSVPASTKLRMIWQNLFPSREGSLWWLEQQVLADGAKPDDTMLEVEDYGAEVVRGSGGRRVFWLGRGRIVAPLAMESMACIEAPTLFIWGEKDMNFPISMAQEACALMPHARLETIRDAGHNCYYDQPGLVVDALTGFLEE